RVFEEHAELARCALRMLPVIGDAGENLAGPRQRRAQPYGRERLRLAARRGALERGLQLLEIVDDAVHGELRRVALLRDVGDADDAAIGQEPGENLARAADLKENQFHSTSHPPFWLKRRGAWPRRLR